MPPVGSCPVAPARRSALPLIPGARSGMFASMAPDLLGLLPDELASVLGGSGRARTLLAVLRDGRPPDQAGLSTRAKDRLDQRARYQAPSIRAEVVASDDTKKLLLGLADGRAVETVLIPASGRTTLCVSSQVGCARACTFCLTATMGLVRSLSAAEIVGQVHAAIARWPEQRPRNLVFMGMGEPLDNLAEVERAIRILTDHRAYAFGPRHITVSTVGPSPKAVRAAQDLPGRLAWSLHAADDELRRRLVPTTKHPVAELYRAFHEVALHRRQPLFVELTLIDGVNDRGSDAAAAVALFADFPGEVRFNLLPMNPIGSSDLRPSPRAQVEAFQAALIGAGRFTTVRLERGADARSACGQLAVLA